MGKIHISQLKQGMIIEADIMEPQSDKLLLKSGSKLTNVIIDRLLQYGIQYAEIGDPYTLFLNPDENMESLLTSLYQYVVNKILPAYPQGSMNDNALQCSNVVRNLIPVIISDEKIRAACCNMQIVNFHALLESGVFVSVYAMMVAAVMQLNRIEILNVGIAGLLHDIGLCEMPYLIGVSDLPENMKALYQEHPSYANYMMKELGFPDAVCEILFSHHERFDGGGFPRALAGEDIPLGGRIVALCSDYEDLINVHKLAPYEAVEYMYGNCGFCYDKYVVDVFTENIPIYTIGSMVELTTGEIGIIVNIRKNRGPRPLVRIFYNRVKKKISHPYIIDLSTEKTVFIQKIITS